jgi:hypothetical protein
MPRRVFSRPQILLSTTSQSQRAILSLSSPALLASSLVATENSTSFSSSFSTATIGIPTTILADAPNFIKPDRDLREYRYIRLPNNLRALLVSTGKAASATEYVDDDDHDGSRDHLEDDIDNGSSSSSAAQVEAAAVHVQAGHFDDTIPGLAHFHERKLLTIV